MEPNSQINNTSSTEDVPSVNENNFMEEIQTYMTFKIATYINNYWFPILVPIGLVGNTLSFLVMIKPSNRKMSTCIYMAAISINDNFMMLVALQYYLVSGLQMYQQPTLHCKFGAYFSQLISQNGTFQVVAMTLDKYIAITWPHKATIFSTPRRAKISVLSVCIVAHVYNIPHIFLSALTKNICRAYVVGGTFTKVYSWFSFVLNAVLPFISLCYMNYNIIRKVRQSCQRFGGMELVYKTEGHQKGQGQGHHQSHSQGHTQGHQKGQNNVLNTVRENKFKKIENQLVIMLLLVTTLFLILMLPSYIRYLYSPFIKEDTPAKYTFIMFFFQLSYKLYSTNHGINFFLYCLSGQKFRNDLKEILGFSRNSKLNKRRSEANTTEISSIS